MQSNILKILVSITNRKLLNDIPKEEEISIYRHGKWHDVCRGPHLLSTGKIGKAFKLTKVSGAYWRGDSNTMKCFKEFMELVGLIKKI